MWASITPDLVFYLQTLQSVQTVLNQKELLRSSAQFSSESEPIPLMVKQSEKRQLKDSFLPTYKLVLKCSKEKLYH